MAVGRKSQPQERAFGDEVIAVACAAVAVFLILAFRSYRPGVTQANQVGLVGYVLADIFCPMFGRACYLLPGALLYGTAVLLRLLPFPAPIAQVFSGVVLTLSTSALLALWYEDLQNVAKAGGWVGGFLAFHLHSGFNRLGAYVALSPLLLVSFMGLTRLSLRGVGEMLTDSVTSQLSRWWGELRKMPGVLPRFSWRGAADADAALSRSRPTRRDSGAKKAVPSLPIPDDDDDENSLPPIIISRPTPPPSPSKSSQPKTADKKPLVESVGSGKPYILPLIS